MGEKIGLTTIDDNSDVKGAEDSARNQSRLKYQLLHIEEFWDVVGFFPIYFAS